MVFQLNIAWFLQPSCSKRGQSSCVNVAAELSDPKSVITPAKSAGNQRDLSGYKSGYNLDKHKKRQRKCCACHEICTSRFTKCCACHKIGTCRFTAKQPKRFQNNIEMPERNLRTRRLSDPRKKPQVQSSRFKWIHCACHEI